MAQLLTSKLFSKPAQERLAKKNESLRSKILSKRPDADSQPCTVDIEGNDQLVGLAFTEQGYPEITNVLLSAGFDEGDGEIVDDYNNDASDHEETKTSAAAPTEQ